MPKWKWKVGQCYRITAFEAGYIYRVIVRKVYPDGAISGDYTCFNDEQRCYYRCFTEGGMFVNITKKRKVKA